MDPDHAGRASRTDANFRGGTSAGGGSGRVRTGASAKQPENTNAPARCQRYEVSGNQLPQVQRRANPGNVIARADSACSRKSASRQFRRIKFSNLWTLSFFPFFF